MILNLFEIILLEKLLKHSVKFCMIPQGAMTLKYYVINSDILTTGEVLYYKFLFGQNIPYINDLFHRQGYVILHLLKDLNVNLM